MSAARSSRILALSDSLYAGFARIASSFATLLSGSRASELSSKFTRALPRGFRLSVPERGLGCAPKARPVAGNWPRSSWRFPPAPWSASRQAPSRPHSRVIVSTCAAEAWLPRGVAAAGVALVRTSPPCPPRRAAEGTYVSPPAGRDIERPRFTPSRSGWGREVSSAATAPL